MVDEARQGPTAAPFRAPVRQLRLQGKELVEAALPRLVFAGIPDRINSPRDPPTEAACA